MKLVILCILINIIAIVFGSLRKKNHSSKKQFIIRRPYVSRVPIFPRPFVYTRPLLHRPLVFSRPVLAVMRTHINECPLIKGDKQLIGKSSGICKSPCKISTCIQTSDECCFYGKGE